ncbi:MAG: sulfotransferase, partial [Deltaproteobacteria bacterium]|nr:sulfotransferase [Deltaproteobacteria bacterium]
MVAPTYKRPLPLRGLNAIGYGLEKLGIQYPNLEEERFIREAQRVTGLDDFGSETFREGMQQLLRALEKDGKLNLVGRFMTQETLGGYLENRLRMHDERKRRPEIANSEVRSPLIIAGLPRTGTTILFNLLSMDPVNRAPMGWELEKPFPVPEPETRLSNPQIAATQKRFDTLYKIAPQLASIHMFGALLPQECVAIMAHEFMSVQFHVIYNVPTYQAWLDQQSHIQTLQYHRSFLQFLQSRYPTERWLLKTPGFLSILDE